MQFTLLTALATLLATGAVADRLVVIENCGPTSCIRRDAKFYTDYGVYNVDATNGCRRTSVPGMTDFCVDWPRNRGHFKYSHQANKRCLRQSRRDPYNCSLYAECWQTEFVEVACNWRLAEGEGEDEGVVAEISATAASAEAEATVTASAVPFTA